MNKNNFKICVIGLGYVGLPLAHRLAQKGFDLIGFDINSERIDQLTKSNDTNDDVSSSKLLELNKLSKLTSNVADIGNLDVYIITVPTPINEDKTPDLNPIKSASKMVGGLIKTNSIVVYESTVYPGVTDDVCTPILEESSKLKHNIDFFTAYSPERIVPGDKVNTIEKITKVVSASNDEALKVISHIYSSIIDAGIHIAPSIKVAEASKITENIQRDVNIALINELHQIYTSLNIYSNDVIEAASTKWNFMKLKPGLVGGHCISVDPYYLMHRSMMTGYMPNLMRSAREINEGMVQWTINIFLRHIKRNNINIDKIVVTILGYTFKENCNDTRNTKVLDLILGLKDLNININLWDPLIDASTKEYIKSLDIKIYESRPENIDYAFVCVYHDEILDFLENFNGPVFDYKNIVS